MKITIAAPIWIKIQINIINYMCPYVPKLIMYFKKTWKSFIYNFFFINLLPIFAILLQLILYPVKINLLSMQYSSASLIAKSYYYFILNNFRYNWILISKQFLDFSLKNIGIINLIKLIFFFIIEIIKIVLIKLI